MRVILPIIQSGRKRRIVQLELGNRKLALQANWRGAGIELRVPVTHCRALFGGLRLNADLDQHNDRRGDCHRRCRMHHDADRTVVRVAIGCVKVRDLGHSQQRKQNQANEGHRRHGIEAGSASCSRICFRC